MIEGLTEEEAEIYLQENLTLVYLSEIDVIMEAEPYSQLVDMDATIVKLGRAREGLKRELVVSH
jgi:hypothetical protein